MNHVSYYRSRCGSIYRIRVIVATTERSSRTLQSRCSMYSAGFGPEYPAHLASVKYLLSTGFLVEIDAEYLLVKGQHSTGSTASGTSPPFDIGPPYRMNVACGGFFPPPAIPQQCGPRSVPRLTAEPEPVTADDRARPPDSSPAIHGGLAAGGHARGQHCQHRLERGRRRYAHTFDGETMVAQLPPCSAANNCNRSSYVANSWASVKLKMPMMPACSKAMSLRVKASRRLSA